MIDAKDKLMGRLTIKEIVDVVNEESNSNLRLLGGLSPEEDVFAPLSKTVKTRCAWLAINLCTAFIASRVIGLFKHTISQLVALATLMPIVAGIAGNTGNQTITMIVRALALHQIEAGKISRLLLRELGVALINGVLCGWIISVITWLLYRDLAMGGVMVSMSIFKLGRDPAVGSSVMTTAVTDACGFFIFLGLATLFLL